MACRRRAPVSPRTRSPRRATQGRRSAPARRDGDLMDIFEDLRSAVDPARLRAHLEWFAGVRRDTGGPGEEAAAEYIAEQLRAAGVEVRVHEFPAFLSYPREAALEAVDAGGAALESFPCVTHSFAVSTPAEGIVEEVVLVGAGGFAGAAGKIAVVDGLCTPVTVLEASRAGVKGLVFVNQGDVVHNMIATTIWAPPAPSSSTGSPPSPRCPSRGPTASVSRPAWPRAACTCASPLASRPAGTPRSSPRRSCAATAPTPTSSCWWAPTTARGRAG